MNLDDHNLAEMLHQELLTGVAAMKPRKPIKRAAKRSKIEDVFIRVSVDYAKRVDWTASIRALALDVLSKMPDTFGAWWNDLDVKQERFVVARLQNALRGEPGIFV